MVVVVVAGWDWMGFLAIGGTAPICLFVDYTKCKQCASLMKQISQNCILQNDTQKNTTEMNDITHNDAKLNDIQKNAAAKCNRDK